MDKKIGEIMSELLKKMKDDLKLAMKREVEYRKDGTNSGPMYETCMAVKDVVRAIISMYPELGIKPDSATDDDTIKLLNKYITIEKTRELYLQKYLTEDMVKGLSASKLNILTKNTITDLGDKLTSMKIGFAKAYLPKTAVASANEIHEWIKRNINWDDYKNKMQAMGPILKHFKGADGNVVRKIIEGYIKYE
jgi:hypothetical protein